MEIYPPYAIAISARQSGQNLKVRCTVEAARGARHHEKFKEEHGVVAYEKAQAKAALASAATKRERTRGKIIQAIGELTAKGESVTMRAVARLEGVSAPTLSQHYRDLFPDLGC